MGDKKEWTFLAHVCETRANGWKEHALETHLRAVAQLAAPFAAPFNSSDWATLAGLWHDLGKYRAAFQRYIKSASGYQADAHIETEKVSGRIDHSTAGAVHACDRLGPRGKVLAYLIAGHHAGLPDWISAEAGGRALKLRLQKRELLDATLAQPIPADILQAAAPTSQPPKGTDPALWIKMLFSCLVDADFLDTEAFMDPARTKNRTGYPTLSELQPRFDTYSVTR